MVFGVQQHTVSLQCVVGWMGWILHDGEQFVQLPPAPHRLSRSMMMVLDPVNEFIDAAGISGTAAAPPVDHSSLDLSFLMHLTKDLSVLINQV